jgi:HD-GYP domain
MTGIGKSAISEKALGGYSPFKCSIEYKKHLQETLYQLKQLKISDSNIYETLESYCERIDGTGYPDGIRENTIPFLSQVCGITEAFELLVNPYHMTRAISPAHAIFFINKFKGVLFEETLVEEFIRAIGLYPTGTLVEISDGQLGVIIAKNHKNKFHASVIPIINSQGEVIQKYTVLDLSYTKSIEHTFIRKGIPSSTIPRGLLENAHHWMFKNGTSIKSLIDTLF